jgi:2-methylcitrate dehydratase PrpD
VTITERLAHLIAETTYEQLPTSAVTQAKRALLDTIGVTLAGHREDAGQIITGLVKDAGGHPDAAILGTSLYTSPALAALANGTLGHALDFDDVTFHLRGHPSVPVVPAVLALGQALRASGKGVITAFVIGVEVEAKVGKAMTAAHLRRGWHPTATIGTLGAAAAAANLLRLTASQVQMALGIAASKAAGLRQNFGTMTKPLHAGEASRSGVEAAQLAQRGFTADPHILDNRFSFFNVFVGEGEFVSETVVRDFGAPYEVITPGIGVKPYPACRQAHSAIDAMLQLVHSYRLQPDDVREIICRISARMRDFLVHHQPQTGLAGKFSMEYCLAAALLRGKLGLAEFSDASVKDPRVQLLMKRVRLTHPDQDKINWDTPGPAAVEVVLHNGERRQQSIEVPKGDPDLPLTWAELVTKFQDCAATVLPDAQIQEAMQYIAHLEELSSLKPLMASLTLGDVTA